MNNFGLQEALALATIALTVVGGLDFFIRWYFNSHVKGLREVIKHLQGQLKDRDEHILELQKQVRPQDWISPHAQTLIDQASGKADQEKPAPTALRRS